MIAHLEWRNRQVCIRLILHVGATAQGFLVVTNSTVVRRLGPKHCELLSQNVQPQDISSEWISHSTSMLEVCIKSARAVMTARGITWTGWLKPQIHFLNSFGGLKTKIKVLAQLVLLEPGPFAQYAVSQILKCQGLQSKFIHKKAK